MPSNNPFQTPGISGSIFCEGINTEALKVVLDTYFNPEFKSVVSIAIMGETGTGKTTLLNKVKHEIENNSNGFLGSVDGYQITDVEDVAYYIRQAFVEDLTRESPSGVSFIHQSATNIVNDSLRLSNQGTQYEAKQLISKFDYLASNEDFVENKIKVYQQHHPEFNISSNLLRAILWTLSAETSMQANDDSYLCASAIAWLKGEPINENESKIMNIPPQFNIINNNKKQSLDILCELLRIVSEHYSVVLAFDELEAIRNNSFGQPFWVNFTLVHQGFT
jgi:Cdc6-like AAA superfamily ATPase